MQFEVSKRIKTSTPLYQVIKTLEERLGDLAASVQRDEREFIVRGINQTFGSINRSDVTTISVSKKADGYLCVASVKYSPSFMFWIFFLLGLWTFFGCLIPVVFYFHQKNLVKEAIESFFSRLDDDFHEEAPRKSKEESATDEITALERLAKLRDRGVITDAEFLAKKRKLLGS